MLYLNYIVVFFVCLFMNVMLGCKNVNDVLYTICYALMSYIVLSFMYIIFRCCLIQCYIFYVCSNHVYGWNPL